MHPVLILVISLIALVWATNHLVTGASSLAVRFNCSSFIIGLTLVAFGTTAPELVIAIISSINGVQELTVGNAIGSNIANIGLVLGLTILIKPIAFNYNTLKKAYPIVIITMLFAYSLILDGFLGKVDGCFFLISCITLIAFFIYKASKASTNDPFFHGFKKATCSNRAIWVTLFNIMLGLIIIPISARYVVTSATQLSLWAGIDDLTIGLTIAAIGTTIPELATSIIAALKGEEDLAIGTILGSNIYNLLLVLIFPAIIDPSKVSDVVLWRDMPVMIALTLLLFFLNYYYKKQLSRWHGGILLLVYFSYVISLVIKAHQ